MSRSAAATIVLNRAAERPDGRLEFHRKLPTAARHKMIDALLRDGIIAKTKGDYRLGDASTLAEDSANGLMLTTLVLTDAGFRAIDRDPPVPATDANTAPHAASDGAVAQEPPRSPTPSTPPLWRPRRGPTSAPPPPRCSPPGTTRTTAIPTSSPPSRRQWRRSAPCSPRRHRARRPRGDDRPIAGTQLIREYQGVEHVVTVTRDGYDYQGRPYQSLSAIARGITGTRWNGRVFFGLRPSRGAA